MPKIVKKNWAHILIWAVMIVYLVFAPSLYVRFVLKNGNSIEVDDGRPADSDEVYFAVDGLESQMLDGQNVYALYGWAFSVYDKKMSPDMYDRTIVLTSDTETYFFPVETEQRPDVDDGFMDLNMNLMTSGFRALVAKDVIPSGKYRIGISFRDPITGLGFYSDSPARYIVRSANKLVLKRK